MYYSITYIYIERSQLTLTKYFSVCRVREAWVIWVVTVWPKGAEVGQTHLYFLLASDLHGMPSQEREASPHESVERAQAGQHNLVKCVIT